MTMQSIVGEPEVLEDTTAWLSLKAAIADLQPLQAQDGSIGTVDVAAPLVHSITAAVAELAPLFPHDGAYLSALVLDFER